MHTVTHPYPPGVQTANSGRYAYLSKMVGMAVTYGKKHTQGVVMGCWTSNAGEPQFAVLGSKGEVSFVNVTEVRFYNAEAIVQEVIETIDRNIMEREARRAAKQEREAKLKSKGKASVVSGDYSDLD